MRVCLMFEGDTSVAVELLAESDAEQAVLGFVAENRERRWRSSPSYPYRVGGVSRLRLEIEPTPEQEAGRRG